MPRQFVTLATNLSMAPRAAIHNGQADTRAGDCSVASALLLWADRPLLGHWVECYVHRGGERAAAAESGSSPPSPIGR